MYVYRYTLPFEPNFLLEQLSTGKHETLRPKTIKGAFTEFRTPDFSIRGPKELLRLF